MDNEFAIVVILSFTVIMALIVFYFLLLDGAQDAKREWELELKQEQKNFKEELDKKTKEMNKTIDRIAESLKKLD